MRDERGYVIGVNLAFNPYNERNVHSIALLRVTLLELK